VRKKRCIKKFEKGRRTIFLNFEKKKKNDLKNVEKKKKKYMEKKNERRDIDGMLMI